MHCTRSSSLLKEKEWGNGRTNRKLLSFYLFIFWLVRALYTHLSTTADSCNSSGKQKPTTIKTEREKKTLLCNYVASSSIWSGRFRRYSGPVVEIVFFFFFFYLTSIDNDRRVLFRVMLRGHRYEMTQLFTSHISDLIIGLCEIINNCFVSCPTAIYRTFQSVAAPFTICTDLNLFMF